MEIDLTKQSLEQLNQLKAQTQQELQNNMASFTALRSGLARYKASLAAVDDIGQKGDSKQKMLVPLTQSLYVAGHSINSSKLLVDIGTGYYVEKNQAATKEFLGRKTEMVETNLTNLQNLIENNRQNLATLTSIMQKRIADIEERRKESHR